LKAFLFVSLSWQVTVMIMSLKAASLGLNMVSACHVLLLDVWWNPTTEDQAIDRAHRIGQTRAVNVSRFTVKNTIEDRILALQACTLTQSLIPPSNY
jgi:SNF2 family DNA or RNA helicase